MATDPKGEPNTLCLAAFDEKAELKLHKICRPAAGPDDVSIEILMASLCHSDYHSANGDWGVNKFPITVGHEIAGVVASVGANVKDFKVGQRVGVGCMVQSCRKCEQCDVGLEQHCLERVDTYGANYPSGRGHDECAGYHTNGGYSQSITVDKHFVFAIPDSLSLEHAAPLFCAGATTYSPLARHILGKENQHVGVVGFGGLGHMAVKIAKAMGARVTVLSRSTSKKEAAAALGAETLVHTDDDAMKAASRTFDVIIDTVPQPHDVARLALTLKVGSSIVLIGGVPQPFEQNAFALIMHRHRIEGSLIAGVPETVEMLEFCAKHNIVPDTKIIPASEAPEAFNTLGRGDAGARRFVIDMKTITEMK